MIAPAKRTVLAAVALLLGSGIVLGDDRVDTGLTVTTVEEYEGALAQLSSDYDAVLVGIRADWCAYCRTIEDSILPHPDVQALLKEIGLVKIDVSAADRDTADILTQLDAWGPPTFFIVDTATGLEHQDTRSLGPFPLDDLIARLSRFSSGPASER